MLLPLFFHGIIQEYVLVYLLRILTKSISISMIIIFSFEGIKHHSMKILWNHYIKKMTEVMLAMWQNEKALYDTCLYMRHTESLYLC